jgi:helicase MOV-10
VAITRAKALLIIVGDPSVLGLDPLWRAFINYIYASGGWSTKSQTYSRSSPSGAESGAKVGGPPWDTDADVLADGGYDREVRKAAEREMDELGERLKGLGIGGGNVGLGGNGGSAVDRETDEMEGNFDKPWREDE